jgi:hypothetical protein
LQTYLVPAGQEDATFGKDVIAKVRLNWDGAKANFYLNDTLVHSTGYTAAVANWTTASSFTIGANSPGGYFASDDLIDEFEVRAPAGTQPPAITGVSALNCTPPTLTSTSSAQCTVTLTQPAPAGGIVIALSQNTSVLTVPSSVMVTAGATSAIFTVRAGNILTDAAGTLTATLAGTSQVFTFTLTQTPTLASVVCTPQKLKSDEISTCVATLNRPAILPLPLVVTTSVPAAVTLPAQVTVPANAISVTFQVKPTAGKTGWIIIRVTLGTVNRTATLLVRP